MPYVELASQPKRLLTHAFAPLNISGWLDSSLFCIACDSLDHVLLISTDLSSSCQVDSISKHHRTPTNIRPTERVTSHMNKLLQDFLRLCQCRWLQYLDTAQTFNGAQFCLRCEDLKQMQTDSTKKHVRNHERSCALRLHTPFFCMNVTPSRLAIKACNISGNTPTNYFDPNNNHSPSLKAKHVLHRASVHPLFAPV